MPTVSEFWDGRAQNYDAQVGTHYAEAYEKTAACFKKISQADGYRAGLCLRDGDRDVCGRALGAVCARDRRIR